MSTPSPTTDPREKTTRIRYQIGLILFVIILIAYLDRINISIMMADKNFLADLGIADNPIAKGSLMSVFLVCYGIGNILFGAVGDWLGPRKSMLIAVFSWSVSCVIGGLAGFFTATFTVFLAARALLGFGESLHWPMQSVFIKNWFPNHERGTANSSYLLGLNMAPVIGMPLFSFLVVAIGWKSTMFSLASVGIIPLLLLVFLTTDHPRQSKRISRAELEYIESALKQEEEAHGNQGAAGTLRENIKVIACDYRFWLMTLYYACVVSIMWGMATWLPSYLKEARGFNWAEMGVLSSLPFLLKMFTVSFGGYASDKLGRRAPFMIVALYGAAVSIFVAAYVANNWASALFLSVGLGFQALGTASMWALLQSMVPSKCVGAASGLLSGICNGISALAPIAIGICISLTGGYSGGLMYLVACGILGGTAGLILTLKKL